MCTSLSRLNEFSAYYSALRTHSRLASLTLFSIVILQVNEQCFAAIACMKNGLVKLAQND